MIFYSPNNVKIHGYFSNSLVYTCIHMKVYSSPPTILNFTFSILFSIFCFYQQRNKGSDMDICIYYVISTCVWGLCTCWNSGRHIEFPTTIICSSSFIRNYYCIDMYIKQCIADV